MHKLADHPRETLLRAEPKENLREAAGDLLGRLIAPVVGAISRARRARTFHPRGQTFHARLENLAADGPLSSLGALLSGPVLARFSGALWNGDVEHLEVLGIALRFRREESADPTTLEGDQDLLFATIVSPFTLPIAPLTTDSSDFMANHYWAVSPFDAPSVGRVKFRLSPRYRPAPTSMSREAKLATFVLTGDRSWNLEVRHTFATSWTAVARLTVDSVADIDQETLRFSPFHEGRGIVPRGLVHAIRRRAYQASQAARPIARTIAFA